LTYRISEELLLENKEKPYVESDIVGVKLYLCRIIDTCFFNMIELTIKNFRCYEEINMKLRRGINLLIGDNSVGKTSLLRACNLVINSFFSGFSDENTDWKSAENDDFREVKSKQTIETEDKPINITFHLSDDDLPALKMSDGKTIPTGWKDGVSGEYTDLVIEKKSKKNARNLVTGLKILKDYAATLQSNAVIVENGKATQLNALPVFAYFTTEDIHTTRKFNKEKAKFKKYPQKPSFGYFESFDSKGLLDCWIKRLLVLREAKEGEEEIENVRNAIKSALGTDGCGIINDIEIRHNDGEVVFLLSDGRKIKTDLLSDGYRRLVSIVIDVAIRCALLNKIIYGKEAYRKTHGTVIIDEIDEHLHPALQVRILNALHNTFPKIQFIVSTHAPLVMSSVITSEDNVVYKLKYDGEKDQYTHLELNTYGLDASTIMAVYMDQVPRDLTIDAEMKNVDKLIDAEDYSNARVALERMLERPGSASNPELTRLEATLSFFEK